MKRLKAGLISFAHMHAYSYARVLRELPSVEFVAISDDDRARGEDACRRYGVKRFYEDFREMFKKEELDFVVITSENAKHHEQAVEAAENGVHILCEKPIATNLRDADDMVGRARKAGVKFQTCFVMRYSDVVLRVKELLDSGGLGMLMAITATNHGKCPGGWFVDKELAGGGAIMDHTVHVADLMRWFTGSEASRVYAELGVNIRRQLKVEDNALIMLSFRNGVQASIDPSWSRPDSFPIWGDVYMELLGSEGRVMLDGFRQVVYSSSVKDGLRWVHHYWGCDVDYEMVRHFVKCIVEDLEPRASGFDGRQALEIALAAYKSVEKGKPVELPLL